MRTIEHRLVKLEQAPDVRRVVWRVFGTGAEADPSLPGMTVLRIVRGVPRPEVHYRSRGV